MKQSPTRTAKQPIESAKTSNEHDVAELAFQLWNKRGCPIGTPEEDWFRAEAEIKTRERETSAVL